MFQRFSVTIQQISYVSVLRVRKKLHFVCVFVSEITASVENLSESPDPETIVDTIRARLNNHGTDKQLVSPVCNILSSDLRVCHVPAHKVFSVANPTGLAHSVQLFPKETCTCPSTSTCCHIIAAKRSIGLETDRRRPVCLTQLRKNSRLTFCSF